MEEPMRFIAVAVLVVSQSAFAADFPGTCRGNSSTVTNISGLDSPSAQATSRYTFADAIIDCHYENGRAAGKANPTTVADTACATRRMKDPAWIRATWKAEANCKTGTVTTASGNFKMPVQAMCGGDNNQAIALFRLLCPSYEGEVESSDD
jgi:hypothetical protein